MTLRVQCVAVDAADPRTLGRWWAEVLGWRVTWEDDDEVCLEPPAGSPEDGVSPDILFLRVPDAKSVKNRLHLDLRPDDRDAEVARVEALGARRVDIGQSDEATWVVLADPEGNQPRMTVSALADATQGGRAGSGGGFCILRPLTPEELAGDSG